MSEGSAGGFVVGVIHRAKDDTEKPEFEIIRRDTSGWASPPPESVRACQHGKFILDEQWATVTCGRCGEKVDPFSALMHYAQNYQAIERRHEQMVAAETGMHKEELKRLARLRDATDEDRREVERLTGWSFKGGVNELREAARRIRREISDRKHAKKSERKGAP